MLGTLYFNIERTLFRVSAPYLLHGVINQESSPHVTVYWLRKVKGSKDKSVCSEEGSSLVIL